MLLIALLTLAPNAQAQEPCRPAEFVLNEVDDLLGNFAAADALDALQAAETSFGCGPQADPELLAKLWLAEGLAWVYTGDLDTAKPAFAAASRVGPGMWPKAYGDQALYDEARNMDAPVGSIRLLPNPKDLWVAVDGKITTSPAEVPSGLHMLQVGVVGHDASFARYVTVVPGNERLIKHGVHPSNVDAVSAVEEPDDASSSVAKVAPKKDTAPDTQNDGSEEGAVATREAKALPKTKPESLEPSNSKPAKRKRGVPVVGIALSTVAVGLVVGTAVSTDLFVRRQPNLHTIQEFRTWQTINNAGVVAAGVLGATGIVFVVTGI